MKNITKQYQDLLEGKMSKANFMVNIRRDFPQWISPVNSFGDAVNILKSKRILSENIQDMDIAGGTGLSGYANISKPQDIADKWANLEPSTIDSILASAGVKDMETREILGGFEYADMMERLPDYVDAEEVINYIKNPPSDYMRTRRMGEASAGNHSGRIGGESRKTENIFNTAQMGGILDNPQSGRTSSLERMIDDLKAKHPGVDLKPFLSKYNIHQKNSTAPEVYLPAFDDYMDNEMLAQMQAKRQGEFDPNNPGSNSILENDEITQFHIEVALKDMWEDGLIDDIEWRTASKALDTFDIEGNMNMVGKTTAEDLAKELVFIATGNTVADEQEPEYDPEQDEDANFQPLREAAEKPEGKYKEVTGKGEYDKFAEMDRVDYRQLMKGTEFELLKMPEITDENLVKAKTKAYKALIKNPKAYMHLVTSNANEVEKKDKDLRMQPVKGDNKVDKANAMKVIKKDEGSNTQTNQGNRERAKGMPEGVKVIKENAVEKLRKYLLSEMLEVGSPKTTFRMGEMVKTPKGEIGTIEEVSPDNTAKIKLENGSVVEYQGNVLKAHQEEARDYHSDTEFGSTEMEPSQGYKAFDSEKKGIEAARAKEQETHNGIKRGNEVTVDAPGFSEKETYKVTNFRVINPGKILQSVDVTVVDSKGVEGVVNINSVKKVEDKYTALKEKLVKKLKEAGVELKPAGGSPTYVKSGDAAQKEKEMKAAGITNYTKKSVG